MRKEDVEYFLNRFVIAIHQDGDTEGYVKGVVLTISEDSIVVENSRGQRCVLALKSLTKVREIAHEV